MVVLRARGSHAHTHARARAATRRYFRPSAFLKQIAGSQIGLVPALRMLLALRALRHRTCARLFSTMTTRAVHPKPDIAGGIDYWQGVPATVDGVLGGYGLGTLPRVDALGSRTFLLSILPRLQAVPPVTDDAVEWKRERVAERGGRGKSVTRALDCGAGVGRVTRDVLSKVVDEVHLAEPVRKVGEREHEHEHEHEHTYEHERQRVRGRVRMLMRVRVRSV